MWCARLMGVCLLLAPVAAEAQRLGAGEAIRTEQNQSRTALGNDREVASLIAVGNIEEVKLGELAQSKAQNEQVKQFAQMMVKDHTDYLQKLSQFAPDVTAKLHDDGTASRQSQVGATSIADRQAQTDPARQQPQTDLNRQQGQTGSDRGNVLGQRAGQGSGQQISEIQFEQEVGKECLKMTKEMLTKHEGTNFDHAYLGQQIVAHTRMLATLKGLESSASGEMASTINQGIQTTQQHLEKAKSLMDQISAEPKSGQRSES